MNWKWEMIKLWFKFSLVWFIVIFIYGFITALIYGVDEATNITIQSIEWYFIIIGLYLAYRFIKFVFKGNEYANKVNENLLINRDKYAKKVNKEIYYFNEYRAIAFDNETKKFEYLNSKELSGTNN